MREGQHSGCGAGDTPVGENQSLGKGVGHCPVLLGRLEMGIKDIPHWGNVS